MAVTFSPPIIAGNSTEAQLKAIQSWMYQFTEQVQYALNNLDISNFSKGGLEEIVSSTEASKSNEKAQSEFNSLKALIIKTSDTVKASYDEITERLESEYVASSDFGTYTEKATAEINETASGITQNYTRIEEVANALETIEVSFQTYVKKTNSYIRTGYLEQLDTYGVAIGEERTEYDEDGNEYISFNQFATLTSEELSFWQNGVKLGYFKGDSLFVNGCVRIGQWIIDPSNGLSIKYV